MSTKLGLRFDLLRTQIKKSKQNKAQQKNKQTRKTKQKRKFLNRIVVMILKALVQAQRFGAGKHSHIVVSDGIESQASVVKLLSPHTPTPHLSHCKTFSFPFDLN